MKRELCAGEHALIVGGGYAGERLAAVLRERGVCVTVTTRSGRAVAGAPSLAIDLDNSQMADLPRHDVVYYLAPPPPDGETDPRSEALIAALDPQPPSRAAILVSTTGVYGDCEGAEVYEQSAVKPGTARGRRRVASEAVWRAACARWRRPLAVLRVAGIYGPGRLPVRRLESGQPVLSPALAPVSNRIHIDDLVSALHDAAGLDGTLDVADGSPRTVTDFYHLLADATGRQRLPETDDASAVPALRAGFGESRRVPAKRLQTLLGGLRYPDISVGLQASVEAESRLG